LGQERIRQDSLNCARLCLVLCERQGPVGHHPLDATRIARNIPQSQRRVRESVPHPALAHFIRALRPTQIGIGKNTRAEIGGRNRRCGLDKGHYDDQSCHDYTYKLGSHKFYLFLFF
jgi:hypothetical protein